MNKYEIRSHNSYNQKAKDYDNTFDGKFTVKFKKKMFDAVTIAPNDAVADIACGNGRMLYMFKEKASFSGYGVDISEKMIEQAKNLNDDMKFFVAPCDSLPFENEKIDVMTVCAAFHHFPDVEKFAKEAERTIKKGGRLYIAEVYLPRFLRWLFNPFVKFSKAGDIKFYSPDEIIKLFTTNGFGLNGKEINGKVQLIDFKKQ